MVGVLGEPAHAASLASAAGRPPLDVPARADRTPAGRRRRREARGPASRENPGWGYKRIVGELLGLGVVVSPSSVRAILIRHGLPPAPERDALSWRKFLRQQAASMLACDFLTVETILLSRIYVLFFVSLERRRIEFVASTTNPDGRWVTQRARNLIMQLGEGDRRFRFLLHDRDSKFCFDFDAVFRSEGHPDHPHTRAGAERERPGGTLGRDAPPRVPRPHADPEPPAPRPRPPRLRRPLQSAWATPFAFPSSAGRTLGGSRPCAHAPHRPRPTPRRAHQRVQSGGMTQESRRDRLFEPHGASAISQQEAGRRR